MGVNFIQSKNFIFFPVVDAKRQISGFALVFNQAVFIPKNMVYPKLLW